MSTVDSMMFLSGNEAIARAAWEAGLKVAAAYPGTPSTEILEAVATYDEIDSQWSVNEKVALEVAYGASMGGVRSMYCSKHVGLNVAMDPLMTAVYTGVAGGLVLIVADDPGMHSSQNEQDTRWAGLYGKVPILEPSDPHECYEFVKLAFDLSEQFDTPVIVRTTTRVSHSKETMKVGTRVEQAHKGFTKDWTKFVMVPGNARKRHVLVEEHIEKLRQWAGSTPINRIEPGSGDTGFVVSGVTYHYVKEIYPNAPLLKLGMTNPLSTELVRKFASSVSSVMVIEELDPVLEMQIRAAGVNVKAKHPSFLQGELKPELIADLVAGKPRDEPVRAMRPPQLCKGCPHRLAFKALGELDLVVSGDIGCYTLGSLPPFSALHTCVCMGAGVTVHEGLRRARFPESNKVVGVIGDSTFVHSGITGLINAAYNRVKGLILILDNGTTAMTGNQDHPSTGKTIKGEPTKQLSLEAICSACGADNVDVFRPQDYKGMKELIGKRVAEDALSVIILRSPCILIKS